MFRAVLSVIMREREKKEEGQEGKEGKKKNKLQGKKMPGNNRKQVFRKITQGDDMGTLKRKRFKIY